MSAFFCGFHDVFVDVLGMSEIDTLILADGNWPSVIATYLQADPSRLGLFVAHSHVKRSRPRQLAIRRLAETVEIPVIEGPDAWLANSRTAMLMMAALSGHRVGASRVVDPVMVDGDLSAMGREVERGQLIEGLLEADGVRLVFDQPLVDLTAAQAAHLAMDLGLAGSLAWPCEQAEPTFCGTCGECRRWHHAFSTAQAAAMAS